ncbi:MAG: transcriptional regulator [Chloroflexi bacterium]|nr:MAG: transcriptional regulator [Chloroflexota bacterium]
MIDETPYRAIADGNRRIILDLLRKEGPLRAGDIVARLPHISQPAVSKHLRILREAHLVQAQPDGRERRYQLNAAALRQVAEWLHHYEPLWDERLAMLKQLAEQNAEGTGTSS